MKIRTYILSGVAAALLATSVGTATTEASGSIQTIDEQSQQLDQGVKRDLQGLAEKVRVTELSTTSLPTIFKRKLLVAGKKAQYALKSNDFHRMSQSKNELTRLYEEIQKALEEERDARYGN